MGRRKRRSRNRGYNRHAQQQYDVGRHHVQNTSLEDPRVSISDPETFKNLFGGAESEAGVQVTHLGSLAIAAVWQSVSIISNDVALLPLHLKKVDKKTNFAAVDRGTVNFMVSREANPETSASECWKRAVFHTLIWGNGYIYTARHGNGTGALTGEMYNLLPDRTCPYRGDDGELYYVTELDGEKHYLRSMEVIHLKGLSYKNCVGFDLLDAARDAFGLALASQNFNSKFFSNGMQAGGILEIPTSMTQKSKDNLEQGWQKRVGKDQWFKTVVLRDGAKFHQTTIDPEKGQLHEVRQDQVLEVARFFNIPPFKLGLVDSQSYGSAEQAQIVYLTGTLRHWLNTISSECNLKLLTPTQKRMDSHFFEHDVSRILETDAATRESILAIRRQNGILKGIEWRQEVNLPYDDDPSLQTFFNPNTTPGAGEKTKTNPDPGNPDPTQPDKGGKGTTTDITVPQKTISTLLQNTLTQATRSILSRIRSLTKNPAKFVAALNTPDGLTELQSVFDKVCEPVYSLFNISSEGHRNSIFDVIRHEFQSAAVDASRDSLASICDTLLDNDSWISNVFVGFSLDNLA